MGGLLLWRGEVLPGWLDYNGHMTEFRYLQVFGESSDALYARLGVDFERATEGAFYTLETHIRHIAEVRVGAQVWTETEILGYDEKRMHLFHRFFESGSKLLATGEHLSLHVAYSKACPLNWQMLERVSSIFAGQLQLPLPDRLGSVLRKPLAQSRIS